MKSQILILFILISLVFLIKGPLFAKCTTCHKGIEQISRIDTMNGLECDFCHRGNPGASAQKEAHMGLWRNPSDYRVAHKTCGVCHKDILERSKKSLHATSAGIISATRYLFGAQKTKNAIYANYEIKDLDGLVPREKGARPLLKALPSFDPNVHESPNNSPSDDYLREECLRCHLWSYGAERYGDYRASGCAACHIIYDNDGKYKGNDSAIKGKSPGPRPVPRPRVHTITTIIPPFQCIHCHNRGGRTGVSFIGTIESDGYASPWSCKPGEKGGKKIHGKYYNHLTPDLHYKKGLYCIDCHTEADVHGDGNIYSKKEQAVEIECQDCHGTMNKKSNLKTSWGNHLKNLKKKKDKIILFSKRGKIHKVPQVFDIIRGKNKRAKASMGNRAHMERLECYACHAPWAPQCYGCHAQQDESTHSFDWLDTKISSDPTQSGRAKNRKKTAYKWWETRSFIRWERPSLGINSEDKVSPFIPGCQVIFTQIGPDGKCKIYNKIFKTLDGIWAIATNPIQPHTISKRARTCEDCHSNPKALGLGMGIYDSKENGLPIDFSLERIVSENGTQLQATSHVGARPFNKDEIKRIKRVGICMSCHNQSGLFNKKKELEIIDEKMHERLIKSMLKSYSTK